MDSQRLILFFVFSFSLFLLLDAWQRDQRPPAAVPQTRQSKPLPQAAPTPSSKLLGGEIAKPPEGAATLGKGTTIRVETDFLVAFISTAGGDLRRLEFKKHRETQDKNKNFVLFEDAPGQHVYMAQTGLIGKDLPNHHTEFTAAAAQYRLKNGEKQVEVRLEAPESGGAKVSKIYRFHRSSYVIDVLYEIKNVATAPIRPFAYFQLVRDGNRAAGDSKMLPSFNEAAVYTEKEKFHKVSFGDIDKGKTPYPKSSNDGWVAILEHYFVSAWLPPANTPREFYTRRLQENLYAAGVIVPVGEIGSGTDKQLDVRLYAGPEEREKLSKIAPGLDLTVDFGWLTVIAVPLFAVLSWLHKLVGNWGVGIILLTILIKLLFYPLSQASYRSMARMRVLAPRLQRLKEQYGNDRQRLQQAMMELYKTEKINPLGGCLPIVVQIPVFISLYWVLLASVELRHAPFFGWIHDLSAPDPWYVLPILMGISMIVQTKLNPTPPDPVQAKVMKIMPVAFSVFFFFFPSGLVLYYFVNNVLSIVQQWHINRVLERANLSVKHR